jgi:hypothetical protein
MPKRKDKRKKEALQEPSSLSMTEERNINNKNHRTQEPTHVEETCTDRKGIKKRRNLFIKKSK